MGPSSDPNTRPVEGRDGEDTREWTIGRDFDEPTIIDGPTPTEDMPICVVPKTTRDARDREIENLTYVYQREQSERMDAEERAEVAERQVETWRQANAELVSAEDGLPAMGDLSDMEAWPRFWRATQALRALASSESKEQVGRDALALIASERKRQVNEEGWTPEYDDEHRQGEIASAAACYALPIDSISIDRIPMWPWERVSFKRTPSDDGAARVRELVRAGALIVAEIERLQRASGSKENTSE